MSEELRTIKDPTEMLSEISAWLSFNNSPSGEQIADMKRDIDRLLAERPTPAPAVDVEKVCDKVIEHLSYATGALCSTMSDGSRDNKVVNIMLKAEKGVLSLFRAALTAGPAVDVNKVEFDLHGLTFEEVVARYPEQAAKHMMDMAQKVAKLERLAKTAKGECMKVAWEMSMVAKQHLKVLGPLFWISDINKWSQQIRLANLTDCPDCVIDVEKEAQLLAAEKKETARYTVIVSCEPNTDNLHSIDAEEAPTGDIPICVISSSPEEAKEAALDVFHTTFPIKVLEDFNITIKSVNP